MDRAVDAVIDKFKSLFYVKAKGADVKLKKVLIKKGLDVNLPHVPPPDLPTPRELPRPSTAEERRDHEVWVHAAQLGPVPDGNFWQKHVGLSSRRLQSFRITLQYYVDNDRCILPAETSC